MAVHGFSDLLPDFLHREPLARPGQPEDPPGIHQVRRASRQLLRSGWSFYDYARSHPPLRRFLYPLAVVVEVDEGAAYRSSFERPAAREGIGRKASSIMSYGPRNPTSRNVNTCGRILSARAWLNARRIGLTRGRFIPWCFPNCPAVSDRRTVDQRSTLQLPRHLTAGSSIRDRRYNGLSLYSVATARASVNRTVAAAPAELLAPYRHCRRRCRRFSA
jgi:hypothetical protein